MTAKRPVRCAIYTRKSTEEGLDQAFNSLDAQREACAAYIKSQLSEGWRSVTTKYDDGGFSGGNMERPGLHKLLADIDHGKVDCVVVYKIDRLTRSLADFAKIVERFDQRNVTFVSVTQSFNTTTSMGRLTLNVLLSFAQFEREVTAERIRDKFAASRAKGNFMGGNPPLGYDARDRSLLINQGEAKTVRMIFKRYVQLGSIGKLRQELEAKGIKTKSFVSTRGKQIGGGRWYVGPLRHLLRNPVYVGLAVHKGRAYDGQHEAIIAKALFDEVQVHLTSGTRTWRRKRTIEASGLLTGLIFDDKGNRMSPQWSVGRSNTKHGFYVSQALLQRRKDTAGSLPRVSARLIDGLVMRCVNAVLPFDPVPRLESKDGDANVSPDARRDLATRLHTVIAKITVSADDVALEVNVDRTSVDQKRGSKRRHDPLEAALPANSIVRQDGQRLLISIPGRLKRYGGAKRVEGWTKDDWSVAQRIDRTLLKTLARAHRWREAIERGDIKSVDDLAAHAGLDRRRVRELLRLAFLAPDIQVAILDGRQPAGLSLEKLSQLGPPAAWQAQRKALGLGPADNARS